MVVKSKDAVRRIFHGVTFEILAETQTSMITRICHTLGDSVSFHRHPNEQMGYIVSGRHRLHTARGWKELEAGDSYAIPRDVDHKWEVLEPGEVIHFFTPPRQDYQ